MGADERGNALSSRSTGRRRRARARWRGGSPSASASPISIPARFIARRRAPCSTRVATRRSGGGGKGRAAPRSALLADPRLRADAVASAASVVAAIPAVRAPCSGCSALLPRTLRHRRAARCSTAATSARSSAREANVKLFITASTETRAERRVKELREQGAPAIYENVLQDIKERDARDSGRRVAPLAAAPDAQSSIRRRSTPIWCSSAPAIWSRVR